MRNKNGRGQAGHHLNTELIIAWRPLPVPSPAELAMIDAFYRELPHWQGVTAELEDDRPKLNYFRCRAHEGSREGLRSFWRLAFVHSVLREIYDFIDLEPSAEIASLRMAA